MQQPLSSQVRSTLDVCSSISRPTPYPLFRVSYGFAVEHNCDDDIGQNHNEIRLLISLQSPEADPWFQTKVRMLGEDPV